MEPGVWRSMGLTDEEYSKIVSMLSRKPNYLELGIFAVMWSEHCSYKTSKPILQRFPTTGKQVIQGPGENAGVVDVGEQLAVVFKMESHNHPSAVEPFHGAATGVGGIVRDIFTMGAKPIALLNSLRFGNLSNERTRHLFSEAVSGAGWYGDALGITTVGGEVYFEGCYEDNPLVNVMCVGTVDKDKLAKGVASGIGNSVMVVGAGTGREGIHGATFASAELDEDSKKSKSPTQVGDPFTGKLLLEACLEIIEKDLVVGMQDMGAAGLTSSSAEMASRAAGTGLEIDTSVVPAKDEGMTPYEIMLSESQERMLLVPKRGSENEVRKVFEKRGLNAVIIGRVIEESILRIMDGKQQVAKIPVKALVDNSPVYHYPIVEPKEAFKPDVDLSVLSEPADCNLVLTQLLALPTIASKQWIYKQFTYNANQDILSPLGAGAAVIRIGDSNTGIAVSTDCNSKYCFLDPFEGGKIAVAEAARNVVCVGAKPIAITNCLNFGNPEKEEVFWQFSQCVEGMSAACKAFDTPVTGGNVSFYNESPGVSVYPTPTIGMVGVLKDVKSRITPSFKKAGTLVALLGANKGELGGSEYLSSIHGITAGPPPSLDLEVERKLHETILGAIQKGLLLSAHDCSEGGLAVALAESAIMGGIGARVELDATDLRTDQVLFGEDQSRIIVSLEKDKLDELLEVVQASGVPFAILGETVDSDLIIKTEQQQEVINLTIDKISKVWQEGISCHMK